MKNTLYIAILTLLIVGAFFISKIGNGQEKPKEIVSIKVTQSLYNEFDVLRERLVGEMLVALPQGGYVDQELDEKMDYYRNLTTDKLIEEILIDTLVKAEANRVQNEIQKQYNTAIDNYKSKLIN